MNQDEIQSDFERAIEDSFTNPQAALHEIERINCTESLIGFIRCAWKVLHPATPFVGGWAVETLCRHLEAVTDGEIEKLLVNIPPGCTKSMCVNVFWPLWEWGPKGRPHEQYISAGYNGDLPTRDLGHAREIQRSEWYMSHWKIQNRKDQDGKENFRNEQTGWRKSTGVGGGLTGWRGTRFIIDDPHSTKTAESDIERATCRNWFGETVPTRFSDQNHPIYVVIMQRLHTEDLSGMIIEDLVEKQNWVHLILPMESEQKFKSWTRVPSPWGCARMKRIKEDGEPIPYFVPGDESDPLLYCQDPRTEENQLLWPERFSENSVDELKASFRASGGEYAESCQLQQRPIPRSGGMFNREDLVYVDTIPQDIVKVRGWDLAATKDGSGAYSVGLLMGMSQGKIYILDVVRGRWSAGEVQSMLKSCAEMDGHNVQQDIPQDPGQAGKAQKAYIARELLGYDFKFSTESGSKEDRARPLAAQCEAGNLHILRGHWNSEFVAELGLFPGGKWKDQVDSASRAFTNLCDDMGESTVCAPTLIG